MLAMRQLCKFLLSSMLTIAVMSGAGAREMVSVARPEAILRDGPGTRFAALWAVDRGYPLVVRARRGAWLRVRDFEGDDAWIYGPLTGKLRHHIVTTRTANIRRAPAANARVVGKAAYGEVLRTIDTRRDWVKVQQFDGPRGWVFRRLLWGW